MSYLPYIFTEKARRRPLETRIKTDLYIDINIYFNVLLYTSNIISTLKPLGSVSAKRPATIGNE